jgi:hypothetical protein
MRIFLLLSLALGGCPSRVPAETPRGLTPFDECTFPAEITPTGPPDAAVGYVVDAAVMVRVDGAPTPRAGWAGCETVVGSPIPLSTDWVDTQAASGSCGTPPAVASDVCAVAGELYAACATDGFNEYACDLQPGMQFCTAEAWTMICEVDDDCPAGARCAFGGVLNAPRGQCEKICATDTDCGRCDFACGDGGLCHRSWAPATDDCCFYPDAAVPSGSPDAGSHPDAMGP